MLFKGHRAVQNDSKHSVTGCPFQGHAVYLKRQWLGARVEHHQLTFCWADGLVNLLCCTAQCSNDESKSQLEELEELVGLVGLEWEQLQLSLPSVAVHVYSTIVAPV